jgi:hypothetical protein
MTLQKFIPEKPLAVTIRPDGRFSFNTSASRFLHSLQVRRLALFGDVKTKQVVLEPADPKDRTATLVTFARKDQDSLRASLEGHAFLEWIGYNHDESRRFTLTRKDNNKLGFTAKANSALPATTPKPPRHVTFTKRTTPKKRPPNK